MQHKSCSQFKDPYSYRQTHGIVVPLMEELPNPHRTFTEWLTAFISEQRTTTCGVNSWLSCSSLRNSKPGRNSSSLGTPNPIPWVILVGQRDHGIPPLVVWQSEAAYSCTDVLWHKRRWRWRLDMCSYLSTSGPIGSGALRAWWGTNSQDPWAPQVRHPWYPGTNRAWGTEVSECGKLWSRGITLSVLKFPKKHT